MESGGCSERIERVMNFSLMLSEMRGRNRRLDRSPFQILFVGYV